MTARGVSLANEIIALARQEGIGPGGRLNEHRLAQRFGVSRGPVRAALEVLAAAGLARAEPRRGFVLARALDAVDAGLVDEAGSAIERAYLALADDRLEGRVPEIVREAELMRRYGLKRASLLRLLDRIAAEGWIERAPGYGWRFGPTLLGANAYAQTARFRLMIEPACLLEPGFALAPDALARLRDQQTRVLNGGLKAFSLSETFRFGCEFHETLAEASGNAFAADALRRINRMRRLFAYRLLPEQVSTERDTREHLVLLDLIEADRPAEAAALMQRHLGRIADEHT